jgi:hypothetical protein
VLLVKTGKIANDVLVQGVLTTTSELDHLDPVITKKPVALIISLIQISNATGPVSKVREVQVSE